MRRQENQQRKLLGGLLLVAALLLFYVAFVAKKTRTPTEKLTYEKGKVSIIKQGIDVFHNDKNYHIVTLSARPVGVHRPIRVVLLHDQKLSAEIWTHTGTLKFIASLGYEAIGVNLLGAMGTKVQGKSGKSEFMEAVLKGLDLDQNTLWIAPGKGGSWLMSLIREISPKDIGRGFIFVSPTKVDEFETSFFTYFTDSKTYFVYGSQDKSEHVEAGKNRFKYVNQIWFEEILGAGRNCYVDRPERFHQLIQTALFDVDLFD